jgi:hypothetical protein
MSETKAETGWPNKIGAAVTDDGTRLRVNRLAVAVGHQATPGAAHLNFS